MNKKFCCDEFENLVDNYPDLFRWMSEYNSYVLTWIELTKEKTHIQKHVYGLNIKFCPMCGKELEN